MGGWKEKKGRPTMQYMQRDSVCLDGTPFFIELPTPIQVGVPDELMGEMLPTGLPGLGSRTNMMIGYHWVGPTYGVPVVSRMQRREAKSVWKNC